MKKIGITTNVPIEVLIAAGYRPVDLNNIFISDPDPEHLIKIAEKDGFPINCCGWIKGIYGVCMEYHIDTVMCVTSGDCSNTEMLMEVLRYKGLKTIPFSYPQEPDETEMQNTLNKLAMQLGTTLDEAENVRKQLEPCRKLADRLDTLTWKDNTVSGFENHLWLVSASDFNGDQEKYEKELSAVIENAEKRKAFPESNIRLAYIGVPSVYGKDLYRFTENNGARVVYNEIQRQFAMAQPVKSLAEQYSIFTYPYSIEDRINDITKELEKRKIDGIIHYVQAFCYRGIGGIIFKDVFKLPMLTLEGNDNFYLDQHIRTRIEAFLDML
ncbi:MAG TPA: 2-hydroxyglutaryl-CoA dehydratase, partial [Dehalococcoidia bacterium]|nr:2-hydroxyglutaryl-CoA dehydratase [Dehalococcoidia bacterium]